jgi:hypothetical protein
MLDFFGFADFFSNPFNRLNGLEKNFQIRENPTFKAKNQIKIVPF